MTQKELTKIIRLAVREELKQLKTELLQELKKPSGDKLQSKLVEQQKRFRSEFHVTPRPKVKLSNDPFLNQILQSTEPLNESMEVDYDYDVNLPTTENGTLMNVDQNNPNVAKVLNAMNRDYSGFINEKTEVRNKLKSMVFDEPTFEPDIEEDLSWLDKVG